MQDRAQWRQCCKFARVNSAGRKTNQRVQMAEAGRPGLNLPCGFTDSCSVQLWRLGCSWLDQISPLRSRWVSTFGLISRIRSVSIDWVLPICSWLRSRMSSMAARWGLAGYRARKSRHSDDTRKGKRPDACSFLMRSSAAPSGVGGAWAESSVCVAARVARSSELSRGPSVAKARSANNGRTTIRTAIFIDQVVTKGSEEKREANEFPIGEAAETGRTQSGTEARSAVGQCSVDNKSGRKLPANFPKGSLMRWPPAANVTHGRFGQRDLRWRADVSHPMGNPT